MAKFQKVEFEFPDPDSVDENAELEIEPRDEVNIEELDLSAPPKQDTEVAAGDDAGADDDIEVVEEGEDEDIELEVVDDTPPEDRGREPSEPPAELTEEELEAYSGKVRNRIKHFSKGYHDERRAKEAAVREAQELQSLVQNLLDEKKKLESTVARDREALLQQAKAGVAVDIEKAQTKYREAYDMGDPDALLAAQESLTKARLTEQRLDALARQNAQQQSNLGQGQIDGGESQPQPQRQQPVTPDEKALAWQQENPWFGNPEHRLATEFALDVHADLVGSGVSPQSDEYYSRLNENMQRRFPELFGGTLETGERSNGRSARNVVAPASRSTATKKIRLSRTQIALAKKLGLTPAQYARQAAIDARKQNG